MYDTTRITTVRLNIQFILDQNFLNDYIDGRIISIQLKTMHDAVVSVDDVESCSQSWLCE